MSAVGTTLLQSPGCNEGKARYGTLGTHTDKSRMSSDKERHKQHEHLFCVVSLRPLGVPLLQSSRNVPITNNPGLAPWAMQEYRPVGALRRPLLRDHCTVSPKAMSSTCTCFGEYACLLTKIGDCFLLYYECRWHDTPA